ncbi:MAG: ROK family protein [Bacteroidia bacterium]|nr:ROK family protein [Bacteroidia bacterium]
MGIVSEKGELLEKIKVSTHELREERNYPSAFKKVLKKFLDENTGLENYIGIGIPGTITKDGRSTIDLPNIPSLGHTDLVDILLQDLPDKKFIL